MKSCTFEHDLLPWLLDELGPDEKQRVREHLNTCEQCQQQRHELQRMHEVLLRREREPVPMAAYAAYTAALQRRFDTRPAWKRALTWITTQAAALLTSPKLPVRLARATALVLVGMMVGRWLIAPPPQQPLSAPNIAQRALSAEDIQVINDYFVKSELLLLTIVNASPGLNETDLLFDQDMARTLLAKSTLVQRKADRLDDEHLISFLNRLEFLLLQISNREDSEIQDAFQEIRDLIQEAKMLQTSRRLQDQLLNSFSQPT